MLFISISSVCASEYDETLEGDSNPSIETNVNFEDWKKDISNLNSGDVAIKNSDFSIYTEVSQSLSVNIEVNQKGSFSDLQNEINNAKQGSVLDLNRDYHANGGSTIKLDKDLTIDGHGHTIDCEGKCSAFHSTLGNIVLKNLKIINGVSEKNGGAVLIDGKADRCPSFVNCTFANNKADDYGGAISNEAIRGHAFDAVYFPISIEKCTFIDNVAKNSGAINSYGYVNVHNSLFEHNTAESVGVMSSYKYINIFNSVFNRNAATDGSAGAVTARAVYVERCLFSQNTATEKGGAICANNIKFINSTFKDNSAEYGGALFASVIEGEVGDYSHFNDNKATEKGGAFSSDNVFINNVIFSGNTAKVDGGAINGNRIFADYCLFESNKADGAIVAQCYGGAINSKDYVSIGNCQFRKNYSHDYGGAIYTNEISIEKSCFEGNTAFDNDGGAIYANTIIFDVTDCVFYDNTAGKDGGALYLNKKNYRLFAHCSFVSNHCGDEGAGIYLDSFDSVISLYGNIIIANHAGKEGHVVFNKGKYSNIQNNWWGDIDPTYDNGLLVEYKTWTSNENHIDSNPLRCELILSQNAVKVNEVVKATYYFVKSDGSIFTDNLNAPVSFILPADIIVESQGKTQNGGYITFRINKTGNFGITTNLHGQFTTKIISVSGYGKQYRYKLPISIEICNPIDNIVKCCGAINNYGFVALTNSLFEHNVDKARTISLIKI